MKSIESEIDTYLDRIGKAKDEGFISTYEEKIAKLRNKQLLLSEEAANAKSGMVVDFGTATNMVCDFLKNPYSMWENGDLEDKKRLLNLYFRNHLLYEKNMGFGTVESPPIKAYFETLAEQKSQGVEMGRVELPSERRCEPTLRA